MLYAFGFIGLFTIGGLTGLFLAAMGLDIHVHDTYFVVAHFHYIMVGGAIMGYLGGLHYWWPKITRPAVPGTVGQVLGADRLRRLQPDVLPAVHRRLPGDAAPLSRVSGRVPGAERRVDAGASILSVGYMLPMIYFAWSIFFGEKSPADPWGAQGLEWETPSPPPTENFHETPIVTQGTHQYAPQQGGRRCLRVRTPFGSG